MVESGSYDLRGRGSSQGIYYQASALFLIMIYSFIILDYNVNSVSSNYRELILLLVVLILYANLVKFYGSCVMVNR